MWYAKMYVSGRHEIFEFDAYGVQGAPSTKKVLPFLESLLSFLELDCDELTPMLQKLGDGWEHRITKDDREVGTAAMMELGKLAAWHIYFRLLYVRWFERMNRMELDQDWGSEEDWKMLLGLRQLPEQLPRYQEQIHRFFDLVLDVSVKEDRGCEELFEQLKPYGNEGPHYFPDDAYTDMPEKALVSEIIREKMLLNLYDEVPHGIAVTVERFKERPDRDIIDIDVNIYCERKSHKGMIIGKGGQMLKKIATQARLDCEDFLGARVNLQCWVKIKDDWRDSERLLNDFGFQQP